MTRVSRFRFWAGWLVGLALALAARAEVEQGPLLSPIFGDHMVLQRGKPNTFWGWAAPGQEIRVTIVDRSVTTSAASNGRWRVSIDVPTPGGPYTVEVKAAETLTLNDVLVGDVWLGGGQSNMEWPLRSTDHGDAEAARADFPRIRFCQVPRQVAYAPVANARVEWKPCTPATAAGFSAVAYYFGCRLHAELNVPIGLVTSSLGGSPAEAWMTAATLARVGGFAPQLAELERLRGAGGGTAHGSFLMHWLDEHDIGGRDHAWAQPGLDDTGWKRVPVPGGFDELGVASEPSVVWFRREVVLPGPPPPGAARILLGVVERMDTTYVNGRWTGASSWVENPRAYTIPDGVLRAGRNVIAVRVFKTKPGGGFMSRPEDLKLQFGDGTTVPLAGEWRGRVSFDARRPAALPLDFDNYPTMPTVLYNGMIAPIAPLAIAGAIWYQGEANTRRPDQYRTLLPALISDWRAAFGQGEFPFYVVGLPAFMARRTEPGTDGWAELRDAQAYAVRNVRNTGLAVTIDLGDANNIHPTNKRPVGERLAAVALAGHYRQPVVASGPVLRFVERTPGQLRLHFDHAAGGLQVRGEAPGEFAVAGADRVWRWAEARIEAPDCVVVTSAAVPDPHYVRYAWQGNPRATLFNGAGLPAHPFRTDE